MRTLIFSSIFIFFVSINLNAQNDTIKSTDLLNEISAADTNNTELLPNKMLITQRLLWGKKGLMRGFSSFELTPLNRQNELKIRRVMLVSHQVLGFATLAGMIAQGVVGSQLYKPGHSNLRDTHEALAAVVNIGYFTTASLSLFAPPKMFNERKGYGSIKLHKALAILHFTSMIATNILAAGLEGNPGLKPYHRAAAYTAFGSFAASMIVISF